MRTLTAFACLALLAAPASAAPQAPVPEKTPAKAARAPVPPGIPTTPDNVHLPTEGEVKLGREGSAEVEKHYKIITSGVYHDRLQRVAQDVVRNVQKREIIDVYLKAYNLPKRNDRSRRVPFEFSFKVVDDTREVNAFSLSGGPIYVTKGLMDAAPSDHELASVLAHECAHVAFHHVEQLVRKQKKLSSQQLWGLLAAVIAGAAGGGEAVKAASHVLMGSQLVSIATLTGYGRELETEADRVAIHALKGTPYNPLGMYTFMRKLAREDKLRGNPQYGIFTSHPYPNERMVAITKELAAAGFATDRGSQRRVSGSFRVEAEAQPFNGKPAAEIRLNGNVLFVVAAPDGGLSPVARAEKIARQMDSLFAENLTDNDVKLSADKSVLLLKGVPVIRVYAEDAAVMGSAAAATDRAYREIVRALWKEKLASEL